MLAPDIGDCEVPGDVDRATHHHIERVCSLHALGPADCHGRREDVDVHTQDPEHLTGNVTFGREPLQQID